MDLDLFICIYQTLSPMGGCDTRPIFKWSRTGVNSELTFSQTDYNTKAIYMLNFLPYW